MWDRGNAVDGSQEGLGGIGELVRPAPEVGPEVGRGEEAAEGAGGEGEGVEDEDGGAAFGGAGEEEEEKEEEGQRLHGGVWWWWLVVAWYGKEKFVASGLFLVAVGVCDANLAAGPYW